MYYINKHRKAYILLLLLLLLMGDKTSKIIDSIKLVLKEKPLSISEISEKAKINWRTAWHYLEILKNLGLVAEKKIKNTRTFFYKEKENYFELPIKEKDNKKISTIYYNIKKFCSDFYKKEPTKTQIYKITWKVNNLLNLGLPIGWYQYGPFCIQVYKGDEKKEIKLNNPTINLIKKTTKEYCKYDNIELQNKLYNETNNFLYLAKVKFTDKQFKTKDELNIILMDLIKYAPSETIDVVTDFSRMVLLVGWDKSIEYFTKYIWKYIAMVVFKESLIGYYKEEIISEYLNEKIISSKKEAQLIIKDLVQSKTQET